MKGNVIFPVHVILHGTVPKFVKNPFRNEDIGYGTWKDIQARFPPKCIFSCLRILPSERRYPNPNLESGFDPVILLEDTFWTFHTRFFLHSPWLSIYSHRGPFLHSCNGQIKMLGRTEFRYIPAKRTYGLN
jgi:hypothetical protein